MKRRIEEIDKDMKELLTSYIEKDDFWNVINPLQHQMTELQKDIKKILLIVSSHRDRNYDTR